MHKDIKWANKEIKGLSHNKLNKLTAAKLSRIENGNNAVSSGQLKKAQIIGGTIIGNQLYESGKGLFGMSEKKKKKAQSNGGKEVSSRPEWERTVVKGGKASAKSPKHPNNTLEKCIHCGFKTTLPLIRRWHNDNCKNK
jgi:hypothetical protein